jgi:hypothetical protein
MPFIISYASRWKSAITKFSIDQNYYLCRVVGTTNGANTTYAWMRSIHTVN